MVTHFVLCGFILLLTMNNIFCQNPGDFNLVGTIGNKTFYIQKASFTWTESLEFCHSVNMSLATVRSSAENDLVFTYLENLPHPDVPKHIWLSGTDYFNEGTYKWLTNGELFGYQNWKSPEEQHLGHEENCVYLYSIDAHWYGASCSRNDGKIPLCEVFSN